MSARTPDQESAEQLRRLTHELKNLLGVIRNHAELLEDALPPGRDRDDVGEIQDAVTKAAAVADRLQQLSGGS